MSLSQTIPDPAKFALIGIIFNPKNDEQPWLVQDNRKALKNEYPCSSKADVLDKIADILDDMHHPPSTLEQGSDIAEVGVVVTLRAEMDNPHTASEITKAAVQAIENAVRLGEDNGFSHDLSDDISLRLVSVVCGNASASVDIDASRTDHRTTSQAGATTLHTPGRQSPCRTRSLPAGYSAASRLRGGK